MKLLIVLEQIEKIKDKIDKVKIKNPETGRENKLTTALGNKDNAAHQKALEIYKKIKLQYKDKDQNKSNEKYVEQIAKAIKIDKKDAKIVKSKLDKAKNEKQFTDIFRKHISNDEKVFNDSFLKMTFSLWNRKTKIEPKQDKEVKKRIAKKPKGEKLNTNDYSLNFDNDREDNKEIGISNQDKFKLALLGLLFGGISKTFMLSKNMLSKMNTSMLDSVRNAFESLKEN